MKDDTQLARWLAGDMDPQELEALKNSTEYPSLLRIKAQFERLQKPQFDQEAILRDVLRHEKKPVKVVPLYRKTWFQVAAVAVILLGFYFNFMIPQNVTAPNGQTYAFVLPDQSEVILNAGSEASFRDWNWDSNREVSLNGEAYFKVAKGKKFSVKTTLGTVTVLGTQFNVRSREGRLDVVCYEGKVGVQYGAKDIFLTPGQSISFVDGTAGGVMPINAAKPGWLDGEMVFSQEKLQRIIAEIERQYNVKINTTARSAQLFSGSLPGNDLDAALKVLSVTYHLTVGKTADNITLTPIDAGS